MRAGLCVVLTLFTIAVTGSASASDGHGGVDTDTSGLIASWTVGGPGSVPAASSSQGNTIVHTIHEAACIWRGDQTCSGDPALCDDGTIMVYTSYVTESGQLIEGGNNCPQDSVVASPIVTPGLVLSAFRRVPLPASELVVQPPGGRTLVNFETNFYTEQGEFTRVVRLLGQRVELRIWPASFVWHYGDGSTQQTSSAGSPYPHLEITHRYLSKGRVAARVDTTYAADFRVGGGPWREVAGTVTIPGAAEALRVVTARPVLVGG
jgi:hypothetical protein